MKNVPEYFFNPLYVAWERMLIIPGYPGDAGFSFLYSDPNIASTTISISLMPSMIFSMGTRPREIK